MYSSRAPIKKRQVTVGPSTTGLAQGYGEAASSGMLAPGAGGNAMEKSQAAMHSRFQGFAKAVGAGVHTLFTGLLGPSEAEIGKTAKYQGQMAYWNAKSKRLGG